MDRLMDKVEIEVVFHCFQTRAMLPSCRCIKDASAVVQSSAVAKVNADFSILLLS
jgi:hypothetical protein